MRSARHCRGDLSLHTEGIACDACMLWFHYKCTGLKKKLPKQLVFHFLCKSKLFQTNFHLGHLVMLCADAMLLMRKLWLHFTQLFYMITFSLLPCLRYQVTHTLLLLQRELVFTRKVLEISANFYIALVLVLL